MSSPNVLILAAGQGKRMYSKNPKVVHEVLFRPMLEYVLDLAQSVQPDKIGVVVGHQRDIVESVCGAYPSIEFIHQKEQLGTGHAVRMAEDFFKDSDGPLIILCGDVILFEKDSLKALMKSHHTADVVATVVTTELEEPASYGRIIRDPNGKFLGIKERADCSESETKIREINAGIYCFETVALFDALNNVDSNNNQGEYYLTDVIDVLTGKNTRVQTWSLKNSREVLGINDRYALSIVEDLLRSRVNKRLMMQGVCLRNPETITIDPKCEISADVEIEMGTTIINTQIESGVRIESGCRLINCNIGKGVIIKQGSYLENAEVGNESQIGPYAHLRPGSRLEGDNRIGNFVEIKKSTLGLGAKASHLAYIGDAEIGENVNLGCGFITCNYDGKQKSQTVIGNNVFVGSDSQVIAPVTIEAGSYIASGTTVTKDVPKDSLVFSRGKQINKPGYAKKYQK